MDPEANTSQDRVKITVIGIFLVGLFILAIGLGLTFFKSKPKSDEVQILSSNASASPTSEIIIHVDGAVISPGVYHLPTNSRMEDAVSAAGGLSSEADSARINLAAKVIDGQKIHIFASGESGSAAGGQVAGDSMGLISINSASESQLDKLPGVGPVTAAKIIASRPYGSPDELLSKKVVTSSVYEKLKDLIAL